jgi:hypothetical protein
MSEYWFDQMIFIPGVAKSGTTTLFEMLSRHPQISPSRVKEPLFFNQHSKVILKNEHWYASLFPKRAELPMEASSLYAFSESAFIQILTHVKRPKFIILVRDPAMRAFSAYQHMANRVPVRDKRRFCELVDSFPDDNFDMDVEKTNCERAAHAGHIDAGYFGPDYHARTFRAPFKSCFMDPLAWFSYFTFSSYRLWLLPLLKKLQVNYKIVFLEHLISTPRAIMDNVLEFLELEKCDKVYIPCRKNSATLPKSGIMTAWRKTFPAHRLLGRPLAEIFDDNGMRYFSDWTKSLFFKPAPPIDPDLYHRTKALLQHEYDFWFREKPELEYLWSRK